MSETYRQFHLARSHPLLNPLTAVVRQHIGPLVLIRDMYFAQPAKFTAWLQDETAFKAEANQVLGKQLSLMQGRISTAAFRSLVYIFLTKMILGIGIEVPVELALKGRIGYPILAVNLLTPVVIMWLLTLNIKLADSSQRQLLLDRAWQIVADFAAKPLENEFVYSLRQRTGKLGLGLFYLLYTLLFGLVYWGIYRLLTAIGFSFLNVVVYQYKRQHTGKTGFGDLLLLSFVVLGSWVSKGVSRLNFLAFFFNFILETPIKLLLKVLDGWAQFLPFKRDEVVG